MASKKPDGYWQNQDNFEREAKEAIEEDVSSDSNNYTSNIGDNQSEPTYQNQGERKSIFYYFIMFVAVPIWIYVLIMGLIELAS